jgi:hypothetical protein
MSRNAGLDRFLGAVAVVWLLPPEGRQSLPFPSAERLTSNEFRYRCPVLIGNELHTVQLMWDTCDGLVWRGTAQLLVPSSTPIASGMSFKITEDGRRTTAIMTVL